jgi:hypothetical protein
VVRHEEARAGGGYVFDPRLVDAEPTVEERLEDLEKDVLGEIAVEAEIVDRVIARHAPPREGQMSASHYRKAVGASGSVKP